MNKFVSALMSAVLCLGIAGCSAGGASTTAAGTGAAVTAAGTTATGSGVAGTAFQAGTYEAEEKGHNGPIKVKVTVTDSAIEAIEADASLETKGLGDAAVEKIKGQILESQGLGVDLVTGATVSSKGFLAAVVSALTQAGADVEHLKTIKPAANAAKVEDQEADIVVIGAGGAGMAAAVEAASAGKKVIVLEKMPIVGGNTSRATGGMNAAGTSIQAAAGIKDDVDTFYNDTFAGGKEENDPELLRILVDQSASAVDWVNELGAGLTRVSLSGGATNPRIHTPEDGSAVGPVVVRVLSEKLAQQNVQIMTETTAVDLMEEGEVCTGVVAQTKDGSTFKIKSKAVILATGGFGANSEMVKSFRPDLVGFSTTNHSGATGDGLKLAEDLEADLDDIEFIQIHPTTDPKSGYMFTEGLRGDGAILVNQDGKRFIDELQTRDVVSASILEQTGGVAYLVTNEAMRKENAALAGYITKGYAQECTSLADAAAFLKVDAKVVEETMSAYNKAVETGKDELFGRTHLSVSLAEGPFYLLKVTPSIHHTMGGLKIDKQAHVLNEDGEIIQGLYAAGEVTGGIHGANRIGGNAVTDIIVFGRIAGQTAAAEVK